MTARKIYFASDFHLGLTAGTDAHERERRVVTWLKRASADAEEIYLLGDVFDFWWEYRKVVPKGFTRFLGTLSALTDSGIKVHIFPGNHDLWIKNYLSDECGVIIHHQPETITLAGKKFYLAHGEGLGTRSKSFRFLLAFFHNRLAQGIFSFLHPSIGMYIGHTWSNHSRLAKHVSLPFLGEEKEDLIRHTRMLINEGSDADFFIYGHRHMPLDFDEHGKRLIILGDWISYDSYAVFDGNDLTLVAEPVDPSPLSSR